MKNKKKLPKIGEKQIMFEIWFKWTGLCWVNEYIPKANGLQKENK